MEWSHIVFLKFSVLFHWLCCRRLPLESQKTLVCSLYIYCIHLCTYIQCMNESFAFLQFSVRKGWFNSPLLSPALLQSTDCQLQAAGVKALPVPGFRPACDERGLYLAQQCFMKQCWCVNPANGDQIPGSLRNGPTLCHTSVATGETRQLVTKYD